jgi:hypothetical protein
MGPRPKISSASRPMFKGVDANGNPQRRIHILQAAQRPGRCQKEQNGRRPPQPDTHVENGVEFQFGRGPQQAGHRRGQSVAHDQQEQPGQRLSSSASPVMRPARSKLSRPAACATSVWVPMPKKLKTHSTLDKAAVPTPARPGAQRPVGPQKRYRPTRQRFGNQRERRRARKGPGRCGGGRW